jgi:hypothetical protein
MRGRWILALLSLLAAARPAGAVDLTAEVRARLFAPTEAVRLATPVVTLRLDGTDRRGFYKCPYVRAYVNGQGPFTFLFDSGASYTVLSSKVVDAARTPVVFDRAGHRDVVQADRIRIGGVELGQVWAIHDDTFGVDGILGFPAFGRSNLLIDLGARRMQVSAQPIPLPGAFELPYAAPLNVPTIPIRFGDKTVQTLIDTGDDAYGLEMRGAELEGVAFAHPPRPAGQVMNGANAQSTAITTLAAPVAIGPVTAAHAVLAVNDDLPVGDIGYGVLRQFRMEFEPARKVVAFQSRSRGLRIAADPGPGFGLVFDGTGQVKQVVPGSAAERAGLAEGDTVLSLQGVGGGAYTPRSWDRLMARGGAVRVRWRGKDVTHSARLPVAAPQ